MNSIAPTMVKGRVTSDSLDPGSSPLAVSGRSSVRAGRRRTEAGNGLSGRGRLVPVEGGQLLASHRALPEALAGGAVDAGQAELRRKMGGPGPVRLAPADRRISRPE